MIDLDAKISLLKDVVEDEEAFELVLDKLLNIILEQHQTQLNHYQTTLAKFETRYGMSSGRFYEQFERGNLGDNMDFFEWSGVFELKQALEKKIERLQTT